jgi:hypothetical protein
MSYAEWKAYWKTLDWSRKWFAIFLMLRPLVDSFYFLKQYSALISPVYIFGILTPLLAVASVQSPHFKRAPHNGIENLMKIWGFILLINAVYLLSWSYSFNLLGDEIKYLTPPVVFLYLRRYIRHKDDLRFLMTNFLISCLVPFFMLGFELFVHPLTPEYVSEGRGGGTRLRGNFADSVSYGLYFIGAFISMGYFFLERIYSSKKGSSPVLKMFMVFVICAVGIAQLRHVATWGVFIVCLGWLLFYNSQNIRGLAVVAVIGLIILPVFAESIYNEFIEPLLRKEMNVIGGDADIQYGLNGRVSRWQRYFAIWFGMGPVSQLFGVSFSGVKEASIMVGGGMHSDYVRILFLSGIVGLGVYLLFLIGVAFGWRKLQKPERFLYFTCMSSLAAYSVSTLPMIYLPFINYIFPIICFALLPKKRMYAVPPPVPLKRKKSVRQVLPRPAMPPANQWPPAPETSS